MDLKKMLEMRAQKLAALKALIEKAKAEERAMNQDEITSFEALETEIRELDKTIAALEKTRELTESEPQVPVEEEKRSVEERDYEAFDALIRSEETRAGELTKGENGAVIPTTIANKIIEKVVEICPIFQDSDRYNVKGTLSIPYYDESTSDITMEYADEFTDGESKTGKFKSINLTGFLGRAISDVSISLINDSSFDVVGFVVRRMAGSIARFIEKELLKGTPNKIDGLSKGVQELKTAGANFTADEIIDLQELIPDAYQANAYFIMSRKTRTAVRKLKDGQGNYLLNKDANSRWGYTLFGHDVYTSENMDDVKAGATVMYYGDYTGLATKISENINIKVLTEVKARQHAVEVLGFVELDAKVQNAQKIAKLVIKG
ncbi:phage major capsid protein [Catonella massiliensis]|uniref:Phage major capsid protein n=1 Tax=Catonella massiliensis TaxID=2799636 RepID=A0ABS1J3E0_9FIRM|nr:phage major capsid protein [Catonella massiliensis]MBK5898659.1 phage major capsid protein [Catonella massiliensis]